MLRKLSHAQYLSCLCLPHYLVFVLFVFLLNQIYDALFLLRENPEDRLTVLLRAGRELLDVRTHQVPSALPRGRARQHDNRTEDEGGTDLRGQQRVSL